MLSKSRICRRLHKLPEDYLEKLMCFLGRGKTAEESEKEFTIDSFPISVCHNRRISRYRIYQEECFRGSRVYADAAYEGYGEKDFLQEFDDMDLMVDRRKNLSRQNTGARNFLIKIMRKKRVYSKVFQ